MSKNLLNIVNKITEPTRHFVDFEYLINSLNKRGYLLDEDEVYNLKKYNDKIPIIFLNQPDKIKGLSFREFTEINEYELLQNKKYFDKIYDTKKQILLKDSYMKLLPNGETQQIFPTDNFSTKTIALDEKNAKVFEIKERYRHTPSYFATDNGYISMKPINNSLKEPHVKNLSTNLQNEYNWVRIENPGGKNGFKLIPKLPLQNIKYIIIKDLDDLKQKNLKVDVVYRDGNKSYIDLDNDLNPSDYLNKSEYISKPNIYNPPLLEKQNHFVDPIIERLIINRGRRDQNRFEGVNPKDRLPQNYYQNDGPKPINRDGVYDDEIQRNRSIKEVLNEQQIIQEKQRRNYIVDLHKLNRLVQYDPAIARRVDIAYYQQHGREVPRNSFFNENFNRDPSTNLNIANLFNGD